VNYTFSGRNTATSKGCVKWVDLGTIGMKAMSFCRKARRT